MYICNTHLSRATADNAWLSKQLENESSRPRTFEADDRGKHAYPDSGHQAYPRQWASNVLNYAGGRNFTVSSQVLSRQIVHNTVGLLPLAKNALHSTSIPARDPVEFGVPMGLKRKRSKFAVATFLSL